MHNITIAKRPSSVSSRNDRCPSVPNARHPSSAASCPSSIISCQPPVVHDQSPNTHCLSPSAVVHCLASAVAFEHFFLGHLSLLNVVCVKEEKVQKKAESGKKTREKMIAISKQIKL